MADRLVDEEGARDHLRAVCKRNGGPAKLAALIGVSKPLLSQMLRDKPISGRVAEYIGLRKVNRYELTLVIPSTEQEQYENSRREWMEHHPILSIAELEERRVRVWEQAWEEAFHKPSGS